MGKMNYFHIGTCLLAFIGTGFGNASLGKAGLYAPGYVSADNYAYPRYAFDYAVKDPVTGDNKAQWEKRDGDLVVGAYSLVEPDGSIRIVEYRADSLTGFNAVVKKIGPSLHPAPITIAKTIKPLTWGSASGLGYGNYAPLAPIVVRGAPIGESVTLAPYGPIGLNPEYNLGAIAPIPLAAPAPIVVKPVIPVNTGYGPYKSLGYGPLDAIGYRGLVGVTKPIYSSKLGYSPRLGYSAGLGYKSGLGYSTGLGYNLGIGYGPSSGYKSDLGYGSNLRYISGLGYSPGLGYSSALGLDSKY